MIQAGLVAFSALCALIVTIMFRRMLPTFETMEFVFLGCAVGITVLIIAAKKRGY